MASASIERLILQRLGWTTTDLSIEETWVDQKGHTRLVKLEPDGDYHSTREKRRQQIEKANRDHGRWRKQFLRQARAH